MKQETSLIIYCRKVITTLTLLSTLVMGTIAQTSTSYNANTIPIGGGFSTAFGNYALSKNYGDANTAIGFSALYFNTSGINNTANGVYALNGNRTGSNNIAIGHAALWSNLTGSFNTANGAGALYSNSTGSFNTANGFDALSRNFTGTYNTASGYKALFYNTANYITAYGAAALYSNTTGYENTANGYYALAFNTTGNYNTANGYESLRDNTIGIANTADGTNALHSNTIGNGNTANGTNPLYSNTSGNGNTASGTNALYYNIDGNQNTANGYYALSSNFSGSSNVAVGDSAGFMSLGSGNIYLGKRAGYYETGSNKLYIGNDSNKTILYGDISTGQILLGKHQPAGYAFKGKRTLNVLGGILSDSVRVSLSANWADYVFANDYQLRTLSELENFIKMNKHLPNVPSAEDVAINGIELGSMNAKLLEKVEELTLYILQQQKQIQELQTTNDLLKKKVDQEERNYGSLQLQIDELKRLITKSK